MMKSGKWSSVCPRQATFNSKNVKRGIAGVRAAGMKIRADRRRWYEVQVSQRKMARMNTDTYKYEK